MQIPQGMGYALLARLPAIIGKMIVTKLFTKFIHSHFYFQVFIFLSFLR